MTRLLKGLLALAALAALCIGAPLLLVRVGSLDFAGLLRPLAPDDGSLLISLVTLVGWIAWLLAVIEVITDLASHLSRGRFTWRPPTGAWIRPLTSALVAAVVAMSMAKLAAPDLGTPPTSAPTVSTTIVAATAPASMAPTPAAATQIHVVAPGEDVWAIAEAVLGDGAQWRVIADLNPHLAGGIVTPGMHLAVPAPPLTEAPPVDTAAQSTDGFRLVTVAAGDSLWGLAEKWLGNGERWPEIAAANPDVVADPDEIEIGWVLKVPSVAAAETALPTIKEPAQRAMTEPAPAADDEDTRASDTVSSTPRPVVETTSTRSTPTTTTTTTTDDHPALTDDPVRLITGGICAALAAGIGVGLAARRRQQLASRALGHRVPHPGTEATRFATALGRLSSHAERLSPTATSVLVGEHEGRSVLVDLGAQPFTAVDAEPVLALDLIGGMTTSLVCADWSAEVLVTVVSEPLVWASAFDHPGLSVLASVDEALTQWTATAQRRHAETSEADDSPPEIFLFGEEITPGQLRQLIAARHPKMHAVLAQRTATAAEVLTISGEVGTVTSSGQRFVPQLLGEPARRALVELHDVTTTTSSSPAPWWFHPPQGVDPPTPLINRDRPTLPASQPDDQGVDVTDSPKLLLLGPIQLIGAQGPAPARAVKQLIEYCAWIHENPGRSSPQMTASLLIAESTRRSNMSRLRTWLGTSSEGDPYLPEAYTGRITLHPGVTSDWEALQVKLAGGVNRAPSQSLVDGLTLVRGAPLADAAPGQWHWAEELRSDMISTIRDMAVVLARRALEISDLDTARWAVHRALQAAPDDELLMGIKIRCEHICGNRPEVERMVLQVTRHARLVGSDLHEETVQLLQEVMEGRPRSQRA